MEHISSIRLKNYITKNRAYEKVLMKVSISFMCEYVLSYQWCISTV